MCKKTCFEKIVNDYSSDIYRFAFWLSKNHSISDDLVQETFLRAWKGFDKLKDENKIKAWLITIVRRENIRRFERKQLKLVNIDDVVIEDQNNCDPQLNVEFMQLSEAIFNLEYKYREPLALQVFGGFNSTEISKKLELNISTVNVRLYRGRNKLRRYT